MNKNVLRVARSGIAVGLSILLLYLSAIVPTLRLGLIAMAGMIPAMIIIDFGIPAGVLVYVVTSIISVLLFPTVSPVYILVLGHYPIFKCLFEKSAKIWVEWALKITFFSIILGLLLALTRLFVPDLSFPGLNLNYAIPLVFLAGNTVFIAYDLGFSRIIAAYRHKFKK